MEGYKKSKLGWIPEEWEVVRVEKLAEITSSKRIYQSEYVEKGIPFFRGTEIIQKSKGKYIDNILYINKKRFEELSNKFGSPTEGDILITAVGTIGISYIVQKDDNFYFKDGNLMWLRNFKKNISRKFLQSFFNSYLFQRLIDTITNGSSQKALTIVKFKNLSIPLPPLKEQKKIAHILSTIDSKIQNINDQITATQDLKKGLMQQLLTEGIGHTVFKDSKLGRIPESWEVVRFGQIISKYGYGPRFSSKDYDENGNVKTIRGTDIGLNGEILYDQVPIAKLPDELVKNHKLKHLNLVMITTADCGLTGVYEEQNIAFIPSAYAVKLSLNEKGDAYYFKYLLQTKLIKKQVNKFIRKGTIANLPGSDILKFKFPLPPLKEQKQIAHILTQVDKKIDNLRGQEAAQQTLKKGLMQVLLTGAVRVKA